MRAESIGGRIVRALGRQYVRSDDRPANDTLVSRVRAMLARQSSIAPVDIRSEAGRRRWLVTLSLLGGLGFLFTSQAVVLAGKESPTPLVSASAIATPSRARPSSGGMVHVGGGQTDVGGLSWTMVIIGGVLVLLGIGAIALILMRRDSEDD